MSFYLDASAIMSTLVQEPASQALSRFLAQAEDLLVVSEFAAAEVASGLSRLTRMGVLDRDMAGRHLGDFDAWRAAFTIDLDLQASDVRLANIYVRRFDLGLRTPDALHVAICLRADLTLVTLDRRLAAAAQALGLRIDVVS